MLARDRYGKPARREKAAHNPKAMLDMYHDELNDARRYWYDALKRAEAAKNDRARNVSRALLDFMTGPISVWNEELRSDAPEWRDVELARRTALSTLGVSMLIRRSHPEAFDVDLQSARATDESTPFLDMVADDLQNWRDFRIHASIFAPEALPAGESEQWYRDDALWVRQVRPAVPTAHLTDEFLPKHGIQVDFSQYETIFPYVVTK